MDLIEEIKIGDKVQHKKDKYVGVVKSIDNIFVHLEDGRHILKCYAIRYNNGLNRRNK